MLPLSQRPLTASDADARLFVGRHAELGTVGKALSLGFNVLLLGERRAGTTSTLYQVLRLTTSEAVFVDAGAVEGTGELVERLACALDAGAGGRRRGDVLEFHPAQLASEGPPPRYRSRQEDSDDEPTQIEAGVRRLVTSLGSRRVVVLLDGLDAERSHLLFGRLRDLWWEAPACQWVVAGDAAVRGWYLLPPADSFFEAVVDLAPLSPPEAADVLIRRLDAGGDDPDARLVRPVVGEIVAQLDRPTPDDVLRAARRVLLAGSDLAGALRRHASTQHRAAALGRPAAMVFAELERLGPVHAGDERLLRALGYTRPRVVQILKDLEQAGLVMARRERRRVLYEVRHA